MRFFRSKFKRGQSALEYLLLVAVVAAVVFAGFRVFLPKTQNSAEGYYNKVAQVIMGDHPTPVPGGWCEATCPAPGTCGPQAITRVCACPAPAFGGAYCSGSAIVSCGAPDPKCKTCVDTPSGQKTPDGKDIPVCHALTPECGDVSVGFTDCGARCTIPYDGKAIACVDCPQDKPASMQGLSECPGTKDKVSSPTNWHTVSDCNAPGVGKCAVTCDPNNSNKEADPTGSSCVPFYCKGTIPVHAELCSADVSTPNSSYTLVDDCSAPIECAVHCLSGFINSGGRCLGFECPTPTPDNACPNSEINLTQAVNSWTPVSNCQTAGPCSFLKCSGNTHPQDGSCQSNSCQGTQPDGYVCPNTTLDVASNTFWHATTGSCTGAKCEVLQCGANETNNSGRCLCVTGFSRDSNGVCQHDAPVCPAISAVWGDISSGCAKTWNFNSDENGNNKIGARVNVGCDITCVGARFVDCVSDGNGGAMWKMTVNTCVKKKTN